MKFSSIVIGEQYSFVKNRYFKLRKYLKEKSLMSSWGEKNCKCV